MRPDGPEPLSPSEVATVQIVKGAATVVEMWRRRLARLVETGSGLSDEQREDIREGLLFLSSAISILLTVSPERFDPAAFILHLDEDFEEHGSLLKAALSPDAEPNETPDPLEPAWLFAVDACARELDMWVRMLEDLQGFSEPPPPEFLERIERAVSRHLKPASADLALLVGDPAEPTDA